MNISIFLIVVIQMDSLYDFFLGTVTEVALIEGEIAVARTLHIQVTRVDFMNAFIAYTPKIYTEKLSPKTEESAGSIFSWAFSQTPEKVTENDLAESVFQALHEVNIVIWEGWTSRVYVIYSENITEANVNTLLTKLPANITDQYTIDATNLLHFLESKYQPKKGGKKRRTVKKRKRKSSQQK